MTTPATTAWRSDLEHFPTDLRETVAAPHASGSSPASVILSFDVEEHFRIEAAWGLEITPSLKAYYCDRVGPATDRLLEQLGRAGVKATFFIVGQTARDNAALVRSIARAGHEVASHGWDHQRVHRFTPASFREDVSQSKDVLEQITGQPVVGYRAPTFSIMVGTAWALDVLVGLGLEYDSSIYPVRHDRYGVPQAPRSPFRAQGGEGTILELPPATLRTCGLNLPMGGGGYFRLFPLFMTRWAIRQTLRRTVPPVAMLYFHPWEFDPEQQRLPLPLLNRWRTYVGISKTRANLETLLRSYRFARAMDVARQIDPQQLPLVRLGNAVAGDEPAVASGVAS
jgi:polysaccharide deacetylase family protein (PEP-CTERM system associated)